MTERKPHDFYPTPDPLVRAMVRHALPLFADKGMRILEPSAGDGAFVRALHAQGFNNVTPLEPFHPEPHPESERVKLEDLASNNYDLIIGNPPFSLAEDHVVRCLKKLAPGGRLVFLLRACFLSSKGRRAFWKAHPPTRVDILTARPSFTGDRTTGKGKTDGADYAVFTWDKADAGFRVEPSLGWLDWQDA